MQRNGKGSFLQLLAGMLIAAAVAYLNSIIPKHVAGAMTGAGLAVMSLFACCFNMTMEEAFLYEELSSNNFICEFLKEEWI